MNHSSALGDDEYSFDDFWKDAGIYSTFIRHHFKQSTDASGNLLSDTVKNGDFWLL